MVTSINNNTNTEPIDIKKAVTSPFTGLFWIKTFMYGLGLSALIFIGFGVYKAYFKKPEPNQSIQVSQGGTVVIKNEKDKKNWIIFTEPYYAVSTRHEDGELGIRIGFRYEF